MKVYVLDSYRLADEVNGPETRPLQSLGGFVADPDVALYSYEGRAAEAEGRLLYSTVAFEKNLFGIWKPGREDVTDKDFKALCEKLKKGERGRDIDIYTGVEPIPAKAQKESRGPYGDVVRAWSDRYRTVKISVPASYTAKFHDELKARFAAHADVIGRILDFFENKCGNHPAYAYPYQQFSIDSSHITYGYAQRVLLPFSKLGMQPLGEDIHKVVLLDCLLDEARARYNNGKPFAKETFRLKYERHGIAACNEAILGFAPERATPGLQSW